MSPKQVEKFTVAPLLVGSVLVLMNRDKFEPGWQRMAVTIAAGVGGLVGIKRAMNMLG